MRPAVVVFFLLLPLQWVSLGGTPLGQARPHQVATLCLAVVILAQYPLHRYAPVLRSSAVFVVANLYMVGIIAAVQVYNGNGPQAAVQQLLYLVAFVALGGLFCRLAGGQDRPVLLTMRSAAAVLCISLLLGLSLAMVVNGVNPATVLGQTIATADPEVFQKEVFKSAFSGFGLDDEFVQGSLRHEIFGSVLLTMLISTWAMRAGSTPTRRHRRVYVAAMVLGTGLLTISLSRSVLIAALAWPLLVLFRSLRRGELLPRQIVIFYMAVCAAGGLIASGLGSVIVNRFLTDTTGYETRAGNYSDALSAVPDVWVTGGYDTSGQSSHNFVVDTFLRNGIMATIPAVVILAFLLVVFVLLMARLHRLPAELVPVVAALALPLVRLGTSGGGLIPPVEWVALAFVAGALTVWRTRPQSVPQLPGARHEQREIDARRG